MLKNRQEGLATLHGIWVTIALSTSFIEFARLAQTCRWVGPDAQGRLNLCFLAVFVGAVLSLRSYQRWTAKLTYLTWAEAIRLTRQQMIHIVLALVAVMLATSDNTTSRLFLGGFVTATSLLLLLCNKYLPLLICRVVFQSNSVPTILIGAPSSIVRLRGWVSGQSDLGIDTIGFVTSGIEVNEASAKTPCLGRVQDLETILNGRRVGQIIVLQQYLTGKETHRALATALKCGCRLHVFDHDKEVLTQPEACEGDRDQAFFHLDDEPLENPLNRMCKRAFDITFALPVVVSVLPLLMLVVWLFQRLQAPGPLFYTQRRTGMTGRQFTIIKFRTMYAGNHGDEARQAFPGDGRVFPFGRSLRHTSLDEFPQFINVLLGEMSVSGPRPHLAKHDEDFSRMLDAYFARQYVKPGMAGLAQCKGFRGEISEVGLLEKRVRSDVFYINNWCFLLDLQIILSAAKQVMFPPKTAC